MKVVVVPHDPKWREMFVAEARVLENLLSPNAADIHHIGSTSIATICAKPIIDPGLFTAPRAWIALHV